MMQNTLSAAKTGGAQITRKTKAQTPFAIFFCFLFNPTVLEIIYYEHCLYDDRYIWCVSKERESTREW